MIQIDIFLAEAYNFLRTVTIKSNYLAERKKADLEAVLSQEIEPEENPYYMNLTGEYSVLDDMMYVTSIDDGTTIEFTRTNLVTHHKTYTTYLVPGDEFQQLNERYPTQPDLIKSILYPVSSMDEAIAAGNLALLTYDSSLLEEQEVSSILDALNSFLTMYRERWHIAEFGYEAYYPMTDWWTLWTLLPLVIFRQRIANLKTSRAHTTHIWEYLTSNGLGDYRSVLGFKEQMFLYKNLQYLIQNRGKDGTLSILSENLLYPRSVALRSKSAMLNTSDSTDNVKPVADFISKDIRDFRTPTEAVHNGIELFEDLFAREHANGLEPVADEVTISEQKRILDSSKLSWLPTKLVELQKINIYNEFHELYVNQLVETILYRISRDELDYNITAKLTEAAAVPLTAKEAVALLFYLMGREFETEVLVTDVPVHRGLTFLKPDGTFETITTAADNIPGEPDGNIADYASMSFNVDYLVGRVITLADGTHVTVTEGNKGDYIGTIVKTRAPSIIPTSAYITYAYKDTFPTIDQTFMFAGSEWQIDHTIDEAGTLDRIETNVGSITSPERLLELVDGHHNAWVKDHKSKHALANTAYQIAYDMLYRQLLVGSQVTLDFGIPHTHYHEWFADNQFLEDAILSLDGNSDVKQAYRDASDILLEAILPLTESTQTRFDQFSSEDFRLMKQMFVQLCSYNIAFLDTERTPSTYIRFAQTTLNDKAIINYVGEIPLPFAIFELIIEDVISGKTKSEVDIVTTGGSLIHTGGNNITNLFEQVVTQTIEHHIPNNINRIEVIEQITQS